MKEKLQQFVPQATCLSCDGCCRFKEHDSRWRPKLTDEEVESAQRSLSEKILLKEKIDSAGQIKTRGVEGQCVCSFFNAQENTCGIYAARPFDCQLYPFVLVREAGKVSLSVHLHCPFVQEKCQTRDFSEYVDYLRGYFSKDETLDFLRRNPDFAGDYHDERDELKHLFFLNV